VPRQRRFQLRGDAQQQVFAAGLLGKRTLIQD